MTFFPVTFGPVTEFGTLLRLVIVANPKLILPRPFGIHRRKPYWREFIKRNQQWLVFRHLQTNFFQIRYGDKDHFFFFCGRSALLGPSVHMLPGVGRCGAGLPPFPTACRWLTHPEAVTGVSVSARMGQSWRMWWTVCSASLQ